MPRSKRRGRKPRNNAGPTVLGFLLVIGVLGTIYFIYATATGGEDEQEPPVTAEVEVVKGDTLSSVAERLEQAGVIENALMFKMEARLGGHEDTEIKTGEYTFKRGEDSDNILAKLTAGESAPIVTITVPEGLDLEQTAQQVARQSKVSSARFEEAARRTDYGYGFLEDRAIESTEGFLFPKQYEFERGTTAPQMVTRMLEQYLLETQTLDISSAKERLNLTEYELVTVASLIEKEASNPGERPVVASVIYNRIRKEMPLQIDASVLYALDRPKEELSLADLKVDSPYNTYENIGLPPGPICSPSRQSLEAAINPAETDYLYYVLRSNGEEHFFTSNYNEFLKMKQKRDVSLTVTR
ncbi:MAG: endolytic transglycosylase MltG [Actinomycetota bacterium]|nr:endolytic transglycosylase MltG [Actinomycetota bacterium]